MAGTKLNLYDTPRFREAFKETKGLNDFLTIAFLADFYMVSNSTIEAWLYENRGAPSIGQLMMLENILRKCNSKIPRALVRITRSVYQRCASVAQKLPDGKPQYIGDLIQLKNIKYKYMRRKLTMVEISEKAGIPYHTVRRRIIAMNLEPGDDVTKCINRPDKKTRKP